MATYMGNTASESEVVFKSEYDSLEKAEISVEPKQVGLENLENQDPVMVKKVYLLGWRRSRQNTIHMKWQRSQRSTRVQKTSEDPTLRNKVEFKADLNSRRMTEISVEGKHLSLGELRKHIDEDPTIWPTICKLDRLDTDNIKAKSRDKPKILDSLDKVVPEYPTPVEFHVSSVAHATTKNPFKAILESERLRSRSSARYIQAEVEDEHEEVSQPPQLIPLRAPAGVLTVNLKTCRDFSKSAPLKKSSRAAVRITIGRTVKYTVQQPYSDPMCFDEWKHFSLQIQKEDICGVQQSSLVVVELSL
ncbi:hypothetical protein SRHO_G00196440 [Serrasalmus rhombeus]